MELSKEYPFGRDVDTLVVCQNSERRDAAAEALQLKARYTTIETPLMGSRFTKIVVIRGQIDHATEFALFDRFCAEVVCRLRPGGKLHVV